MFWNKTLRWSGVLVAVGLISILFAERSEAQTLYTWADQGTDWGTATDWSPAGPPTSIDTALFASGGYSFQPVTLAASYSAGSLWVTGAGAVTIGPDGNTLTLAGANAFSGHSTAGIELDPGAGALTISDGLSLGAAQQWVNNSSSLLTVSGGVNNAGNMLTVSGSGNSTITGLISGAGGLTLGGGALALTNENTFGGNTIVNGGTLGLTANNSANSCILGTLTVNSGALVNLNGPNAIGFNGGALTTAIINGGVINNNGTSSTTAVGFSTNFILTGGSITNSFNGNSSTSEAGAVNFNTGVGISSSASSTLSVVTAPINIRSGNVPITVQHQPGNAVDLLITGGIYGGGPLTLSGGGVLAFNALNTYTGNTVINGGTLQLNTSNGGSGGALASPTITVNAGGVLQLNANNTDVLGFTGGRNALTINDGIVTNTEPGGVANTGRLTLQNTVTMTGGTLTGTGAGDPANGNAAYQVNASTGFNATSDANGNPAVVSLTAPAVLGEQASSTYNVTRGPMSPAADMIIASPIALFGGSHGMIKAGNGILELTSTNTYTGTTTVSGGTLQLGSGAAGQDGTIGSTSGVTDTAMLAYNLYGNQSVAYGISGSGGSLTKLGQGQLTLTHSNGYTGLTTVGAGTLALGSTGTVGSGGVTIVPGGVLDVSAYGSGGYNFTSGVLSAGRASSPATDINGSLNVNGAALAPAGNSTMTLSGSLAMSGGSLDYNSGGLVALPNGALTLTGSDYVVPQLQLSTGTYALFTYSNGSPNTSDLSVAGPNFSSRQMFTFNASAGTVSLAVSGNPGSLYWSAAGNVWYTGTTSTKSWYNANSSSADWFFAGDNVTFSDSGSSPQNVTISGAVQPASITVSNTAVSYIFGGTGSIIGGTSLVMNGPGSLTINNSNTYSGGTNLSGGTLNANAASALGTGTVSVAGGVLNVNAAQPITGLSITNGVVNDGAANSLGTGPLAINGGTLTASYPQSLASATLNSGVLGFAGSGALSGVALTIAGGSLDNSSGSALTLSGNFPQNWNGDFTFNGTQSLNMGTGAVTLGSSRTVTVNANTLTVGGAISGNGDSLRKAGPGNLTLGAANSYSGGTIVNGGTLQLNTGNGGLGALASPTITVNSGAFLALNANDVIGYTTGRNALFINDGVVSTISSGVRVTIQNTVTMTGGTLSATGAGNNGANYSFNGGNGFVATSDAGGNPAVVNAAAIGLQSINLTINVTRGPANPAADMIIASSITPFGSSNGIAIPGNGVLQLTAASTYIGATAVNGGTLQLGSGAAGQDGSIANTSGVTNNAALVYNLYGNQLAAYGISGNGSLTKLGQGQLTLAGNNTDSGAITVGGGSLYVNVASSGTAVSVAGGATFGGAGSLPSAAANVANGGILDFSQNNTGSTFSLSSLTYAGSSTLNLGALVNYTAVSPLSAGALTTSGAVNINANLGAVSVLAGTYDLVNYNSIAGTGTSAFNLASVGGLSNRQSASLLEAPGQVELVISGQTPVWSGNQPDWLSTNAFTLQPSGAPTTFQPGDVDVFNDSASAGTAGVGGTVLINSGNVSSSSVTFNNDNALAYTVSGSYGITGSGALVVQGGGSVTLVNSNGYTGGTTVSNGTLQLGNGGATGSLSPSGAIALGGNGQLIFNRSDSPVQGTDFGGPIGGAGSVVQNGPGAVVLTTSNGYTGTTTINGGTLQLGTGASGPDGSIPNTSGVNNNGTLAYNIYGSQMVAYSIGGGGSVEIAGPGLLTLTTPKTYTGGTTVNGGTLQLNTGNGGAGALASPTITVNAGGFLALNAGDILGYTNNRGALVINGGIVSNITADDRVTIQNQITMTGGTLTGTGTGDFNNSGVPYGQYSINNNNVGILATSDSNGNPAIISASLGPQGGTMLFTVNRGGASPAYDLIVSGAISSFGGGGNGMAMAGNGIMLLTGSNTYNGATSVSGGTLQLGSGAAGQDGSIANTSGVTNNAALVYNLYGNQTASYAISGNGSLTKLGQGQLTLNGNNTDSGAITVGGGSLSINFGSSPATSVSVAGGATFGGAGSLATATATVDAGGSIVGGYNGVGTLTLGSLAYGGSGSFTASGYSNFSAASGGAAALDVTADGGLNPGAGPVVINLGGPPAASSGYYHLIQYSGAIGGSGFAAFTLGTTANNPRGQVSIALANDPGYVDAFVSITPVIWTGSLSTAWNANDTLPAPMNWSYAGSGTDFQPGDVVQFDNSTVSGGTVNISNGNVLPDGVLFFNDTGHPYTLTGINGIGGSGQLIKNGLGSLAIGTSNSYTGGTNLYAGTLNANAASALGTGALTVNGGTLNSNFPESVASATLNAGLLVLNNNSAIGPGTLTISGGTLDSAAGGVTLANNTQNWNGDFTFIGTQSLNMGTGAVTLGSNRTVTVNANTLTVNGAISDGGGGYSLTKAGPGNLTLTSEQTGVNGYSGNTIVNGGTLQLNVNGDTNGGAGALNCPTITVNNGAVLALNGPDALGFAPGFEALVINDGTVANIAAATRVTIQNVVTMTGGTLTGPSTGDAGGTYSLNNGNAFAATSDAAGNPAVVNAPSIGLQAGLTINVTRGPANPPADMIITSDITPFFGSGNGIVKSGNGVLVLSGSNSYIGGTTVNDGTLIVTAPTAIADGTNLAVGDPALLALLPAPVVPAPAAVAPVPEPGTMTLFVAGAVLAFGVLRRRRL